MKREDVTKIFEGATEEQVNSLLNIHSADIGNAKKALETERDSLKEQLKTAQDSLKGFEGVDVKDLQAKVTALTADLAAKQKEHEAKIADMEFSSALDAAISGSKAKNAKAVRALLDVETLKRRWACRSSESASATRWRALLSMHKPLRNRLTFLGKVV